jgi:type II secretory pathway pseudopilin PulG
MTNNGSLQATFRSPDSTIGYPSFSRQRPSGFTILELLVVITIIIILAGLTIATMNYVQTKARRARAEAEIAAISAALENYKADNGVYPSDGNTDGLDPGSTKASDPKNYSAAGGTLYIGLSGDKDADPVSSGDDVKNYIGPLLKAGSLATPSAGTPYLKDPWGNAYGYSTAKRYNPTFDLWSIGAPPPTGKASKAVDQSQWIKNW